MSPVPALIDALFWFLIAVAMAALIVPAWAAWRE
jgi:hypothetical protein